MSKKNNKSIAWNIWKCLECDGHPEFEHTEMMDHLRNAHGIDTKTEKCQRTMTCHLDGRDWYQSDYEINVRGMRFVNSIRSIRAKNDLTRIA